MNALMLQFGYYYAAALIAMVIGVRGYRVLRRRALRNQDATAAAAPSARYR